MTYEVEIEIILTCSDLEHLSSTIFVELALCTFHDGNRAAVTWRLFLTGYVHRFLNAYDTLPVIFNIVNIPHNREWT